MNARLILVLMEESVPKDAPEISTVYARLVIMGPSVRKTSMNVCQILVSMANAKMKKWELTLALVIMALLVKIAMKLLMSVCHTHV